MCSVLELDVILHWSLKLLFGSPILPRSGKKLKVVSWERFEIARSVRCRMRGSVPARWSVDQITQIHISLLSSANDHIWSNPSFMRGRFYLQHSNKSDPLSRPGDGNQQQRNNICSCSVIIHALWRTSPFSLFHLHITLNLEHYMSHSHCHIHSNHRENGLGNNSRSTGFMHRYRNIYSIYISMLRRRHTWVWLWLIRGYLIVGFYRKLTHTDDTALFKWNIDKSLTLHCCKIFIFTFYSQINVQNW